MAKLSRAEAEQRAKTLNGWTLEGDVVRKQYSFATFPDAVAFVTRWPSSIALRRRQKRRIIIPTSSSTTNV